MLLSKLFQTKWYNRLTNDGGSTLIEYALLVGMIATVAVAAVICLTVK